MSESFHVTAALKQEVVLHSTGNRNVCTFEILLLPACQNIYTVNKETNK